MKILWDGTWSKQDSLKPFSWKNSSYCRSCRETNVKRKTCGLEDKLDATELTPFSKMVDPVQDQNTSQNPVRSIN